MNKTIAAGVAAGALLLGSLGAATVLPSLVAAADASASPATGAAATTPSTPTWASAGDRADHGGPGGLDADDLTAAAQALGMTETDLTTALDGGQTVAAVATSRSVDLQKVIDAIVSSDKAEFAAAVEAGTMTQAQADQMTANLTAHVTDEVNGVAGAGRAGQPGHRGFDADDLTAAAQALGMTETDLTTALQTQSAAAVAKAKGVDVQKVIDAIVAADKAEIDAAVKAGTITQAQADQRLANLTAHVTDEVNGVAGAGRGGHGGHGHGDPPSTGTSNSGSTSTGSNS